MAFNPNVDVGTGSSPRVYALTPADTDLLIAIRKLYVTAAGNLKLTFVNGVVETIAVPAGYEVTAMIARVWATGTTATGFLGFE